ATTPGQDPELRLLGRTLGWFGGLAFAQDFDVNNLDRMEWAIIRVPGGICNGQAPGPVELEVRAKLVPKRIAGISRSVPRGIATLNHEIRDDAMEDRT